jgi:hypothetical protein
MSVEEIAQIVTQRRMRYEYLGMLNTYGLNEVERARLNFDYDDARRALEDAERTLRAAVAAEREVDSLILKLRGE